MNEGARETTDITIPERYPSTVVTAGQTDAAELGFHLVLADVVDPAAPLRHDPAKLAQALIRLYYEQAERPPAAIAGSLGAAGPR